jgi:HlyD family secretion protein
MTKRIILPCLLGLLGLSPFLSAVGQDEPKTKPKPRYRTEAVKRCSFGFVQATGTLEPEEVIDIGAQVSGPIVAFGADPADPKKRLDYGTRVEQGTVLARIDPAPYQGRVDQARAKAMRAEAELKLVDAHLRKAERDLARVKKLFEGKTAAREDVENAESAVEIAVASVEVSKAGLEEAQVALKKAERDLERTTIRSPVNGVIVDRRVNVGQTVTDALTAPSLFLVATDLRRLAVWASVFEMDISHVREGQDVTFTVDAYPKDVFTGKVAKIRLNANMTQNVVTYTVVVHTDNPADKDHPSGKLLPYLTADVRFQVTDKKGVLLVPNAALDWDPPSQSVDPAFLTAYASFQAETFRAQLKREEPKLPYRLGLVWVEGGSGLRPIVLHLGRSDGKMTEVVNDKIKEGAKIIIPTEE